MQVCLWTRPKRRTTISLSNSTLLSTARPIWTETTYCRRTGRFVKIVFCFPAAVAVCICYLASCRFPLTIDLFVGNSFYLPSLIFETSLIPTFSFRFISLMRYVPENRKIMVISEDADNVMIFDEKFRVHTQVRGDSIFLCSLFFFTLKIIVADWTSIQQFITLLFPTLTLPHFYHYFSCTQARCR